MPSSKKGTAMIDLLFDADLPKKGNQTSELVHVTTKQEFVHSEGSAYLLAR